MLFHRIVTAVLFSVACGMWGKITPLSHAISIPGAYLAVMGCMLLPLAYWALAFDSEEARKARYLIRVGARRER